MDKGECIKVGRVSRLHGFKGELSLKLEHSLPFDYAAIEVYFIEINDKLVPYFVDSVRFTPQGYALVYFEGLDNEVAAKKLLRNDLYLPSDEMPSLEEGEYVLQELIGFQVVDTLQGPVGKVVEVVEHPGNILLVVEGVTGDVLIPMNEQFTDRVDTDAGLITVTTPEGLLDLN